MRPTGVQCLVAVAKGNHVMARVSRIARAVAMQQPKAAIKGGIVLSAKRERHLTEAEQKRLDAFNATCDRLVSEGYTRTNLEIGLVRANVVAIVVVIVLLFALIPLFFVTQPEYDSALSIGWFLFVLVVFLVLIVVHELIHGLTWSFFTPHGFKDIDFGIMRDTLTPYCTCSEPLHKGAYITGALMPLIILGILPIAIAFIAGNMSLLYLGIFMTAAAMGDVMIVIRVLRYKAASSDVLLYDHPTEAGSVVFER